MNIFCLMLCGLVAAYAAGNYVVDRLNIQVDNGSASGTEDGSKGSPYKTLAAALAIVTSGGVVHVARSSPYSWDAYAITLAIKITRTGATNPVFQSNGAVSV